MALKAPKPKTETAIETDDTAQATATATTEQSSTEVATTTATQPPVSAQPPVTGNLESALAEQGFEGMEVGFHSFTTIKLESGSFSTSDDEDLGTEIEVNLISSRPKYLYSDGRQQDDDDSQSFYSYDKIHSTDGRLVEDILNDWKEEGITPTEKRYLDVTVDILSGELEGEMAILSVAPASVQKLTGYMGKLTRRGYNPSEVVTVVSVGSKVKLKNNTVFNPWKFSLKQ